jgi:hypothetical protein
MTATMSQHRDTAWVTTDDLSDDDVVVVTAMGGLAQASRRRHLDLCAVMHPSGALSEYARSCRLDALLPIYDSLPVALASASAEL